MFLGTQLLAFHSLPLPPLHQGGGNRGISLSALKKENYYGGRDNLGRGAELWPRKGGSAPHYRNRGERGWTLKIHNHIALKIKFAL